MFPTRILLKLTKAVIVIASVAGGREVAKVAKVVVGCGCCGRRWCGGGGGGGGGWLLRRGHLGYGTPARGGGASRPPAPNATPGARVFLGPPLPGTLTLMLSFSPSLRLRSRIGMLA